MFNSKVGFIPSKVVVNSYSQQKRTPDYAAKDSCEAKFDTKNSKLAATLVTIRFSICQIDLISACDVFYSIIVDLKIVINERNSIRKNLEKKLPSSSWSSTAATFLFACTGFCLTNVKICTTFVYSDCKPKRRYNASVTYDLAFPLSIIKHTLIFLPRF